MLQEKRDTLQVKIMVFPQCMYSSNCGYQVSIESYNSSQGGVQGRHWQVAFAVKDFLKKIFLFKKKKTLVPWIDRQLHCKGCKNRSDSQNRVENPKYWL